MQLFRRLAGHDRAVLVATHATTSLDLCDEVIVLQHGQIAYRGGSSGARAHVSAVAEEQPLAEGCLRGTAVAAEHRRRCRSPGGSPPAAVDQTLPARGARPGRPLPPHACARSPDARPAGPAGAGDRSPDRCGLSFRSSRHRRVSDRGRGAGLPGHDGRDLARAWPRRFGRWSRSAGWSNENLTWASGWTRTCWPRPWSCSRSTSSRYGCWCSSSPRCGRSGSASAVSCELFASPCLPRGPALRMGLAVSCAARSVDQAAGAVPLLLMPQLLLAGGLIPLAQMPANHVGDRQRHLLPGGPTRASARPPTSAPAWPRLTAPRSSASTTGSSP